MKETDKPNEGISNQASSSWYDLEGHIKTLIVEITAEHGQLTTRELADKLELRMHKPVDLHQLGKMLKRMETQKKKKK
jgi:hypothetical protein